MAGTKQADEIYNNLISPAVSTVTSIKNGESKSQSNKKSESESKPAPTVKPDSDTGYKSSERTALENQLLQIETSARADSESKE